MSSSQNSTGRPGLYPIIRRVRRPLLPEEPAAKPDAAAPTTETHAGGSTEAVDRLENEHGKDEPNAK